MLLDQSLLLKDSYTLESLSEASLSCLVILVQPQTSVTSKTGTQRLPCKILCYAEACFYSFAAYAASKAALNQMLRVNTSLQVQI